MTKAISRILHALIGIFLVAKIVLIAKIIETLVPHSFLFVNILIVGGFLLLIAFAIKSKFYKHLSSKQG